MGKNRMNKGYPAGPNAFFIRTIRTIRTTRTTTLEKTMKLSKFLGTQIERDDVVGDLARDAARDPGFPETGSRNSVS